MKTEDINQAKATQVGGKKDSKIKKVVKSVDKKAFLSYLGMFGAAFAGSAAAEVVFPADDDTEVSNLEEVEEVEEVEEENGNTIEEIAEDEVAETEHPASAEEEKPEVEPYVDLNDEPAVVVWIDEDDYDEDNVFEFKDLGYHYDDYGNVYPVALANVNGVDVLLVDVSDDMEFDYVLLPTGEYMECPGGLTFGDVQLALMQSGDVNNLAYIEPDETDGYDGSFTVEDDYDDDPLA